MGIRTITCSDEGRGARLERKSVDEKMQEDDVSFGSGRVRNLRGETTG